MLRLVLAILLAVLLYWVCVALGLGAVIAIVAGVLMFLLWVWRGPPLRRY